MLIHIPFRMWLWRTLNSEPGTQLCKLTPLQSPLLAWLAANNRLPCLRLTAGKAELSTTACTGCTEMRCCRWLEVSKMQPNLFAVPIAMWWNRLPIEALLSALGDFWDLTGQRPEKYLFWAQNWCSWCKRCWTWDLPSLFQSQLSYIKEQIAAETYLTKPRVVLYCSVSHSFHLSS